MVPTRGLALSRPIHRPKGGWGAYRLTANATGVGAAGTLRIALVDAATGEPLPGYHWETCAEVARAMSLGPALKLGPWESNAGGRLRAAVLADVCEALIGAVFIDGGYAPAAALVERFWKERMLRPKRPLRDAKTMLQEWAQARGMPTPLYREIERSGPAHDPEFRVSVEVADCAPAEGMGRSKRAAEQAAASAMLIREGVVKEASGG